MEAEDYFAQSGDADLTCNMHGIKVEAVLFYETEILVRLSGGNGHILSQGKMQHWTEMTQMEMSLGIEESEEARELIKIMVDMLSKWRDNETELGLYSAPGKMTTLVQDSDVWLPVPCGTLGN